MSLPLFPGVEDVLTILMGELPQGVYATDRADNQDKTQRSYSSSELRTQAQMIADLYANLEDIWQNKWVTTLNPDGLAAWELELFSEAQDGSMSLEARRANLLAKRRAQGSISLPAIAGIISGILDPLGLAFEILPYNGCNSTGGVNSAWILGSTPLGEFTYLSDIDPIIGATRDPSKTPLDCSLNAAAAGLTTEQVTAIQTVAYTYAVAIYGNADAATLALLDKFLTADEPARSTHVIINNATTPDEADATDAELFPLSNFPWETIP